PTRRSSDLTRRPYRGDAGVGVWEPNEPQGGAEKHEPADDDQDLTQNGEEHHRFPLVSARASDNAPRKPTALSTRTMSKVAVEAIRTPISTMMPMMPKSNRS